MKKQNLEKGKTYYCLVGGHWSPAYALVKAKYINSAGYSGNPQLVFMEQNVDGVIHRFEADADKIYPLDKEILSAVLHNDRQTRRIIEHDKTYDHKNAKEKIEGWIATLLETDQKALRARYREMRPRLVRADGTFLGSKFKMVDWSEVMRLYFSYKYPKVKIPELDRTEPALKNRK